MAEYAELIEALRDGCDWTDVSDCMRYEELMHDAAAAIEALQAEAGQWKAAVKGQEDGIKVLQAEVERLRAEMDSLIADAGARVGKAEAEVEQKKKDIAVLQKCYQIADEAVGKALEPKHGKWIGVSPFVDSVQCSECGYCIYSEELETPYCPWCGAKMENVND